MILLLLLLTFLFLLCQLYFYHFFFKNNQILYLQNEHISLHFKLNMCFQKITSVIIKTFICFSQRKRKHVTENCSGLLFYYSKYLILAYPESTIIPGKIFFG